MDALAQQIIDKLDPTCVDVPFPLPAHGDIHNEACLQFHYESTGGRHVECLVAESGVYLIQHIGGQIGEPVHFSGDWAPVRIAEAIVRLASSRTGES